MDVLEYLRIYKHTRVCEGQQRKREREGEREGVLGRALKYKWVGGQVLKLVNGGILLIIPRYEDRM